MDRIILTITSELFDDNTHQEASVRPNITIRTLIDETRREFNLMEGNYAFTLAGEDAALPDDQTIEQLGIQMGSELVFDRQRRSLSQHMIRRGAHFFQPVTGVPHAFLREEASRTIFDIDWHPAVIGRPDASNPASADMLAADVGEMEEGKTVSRQHARIMVQGGHYFLEPLAPRNPTFLNERELVMGEKARLQNGDKLQMGQVMLTFHMDER